VVNVVVGGGGGEGGGGGGRGGEGGGGWGGGGGGGGGGMAGAGLWRLVLGGTSAGEGGARGYGGVSTRIGGTDERTGAPREEYPGPRLESRNLSRVGTVTGGGASRGSQKRVLDRAELMARVRALVHRRVEKTTIGDTVKER